jgi:hypothetical protein
MRNCNYIGNPPMFRSRVQGVGDLFSTISDMANKMSEDAAKQAEADKKAKAILDQEKTWRTSSPIFTFTGTTYMFEVGPVKAAYAIYGYNKQKGLVWMSVDGGEVMLRPESELADFPEWQAAKNSLQSTVSTPSPAPTAKPTGSALPLLLGAAYLLLS